MDLRKRRTPRVERALRAGLVIHAASTSATLRGMLARALADNTGRGYIMQCDVALAVRRFVVAVLYETG